MLSQHSTIDSPHMFTQQRYPSYTYASSVGTVLLHSVTTPFGTPVFGAIVGTPPATTTLTNFNQNFNNINHNYNNQNNNNNNNNNNVTMRKQILKNNNFNPVSPEPRNMKIRPQSLDLHNNKMDIQNNDNININNNNNNSNNNNKNNKNNKNNHKPRVINDHSYHRSLKIREDKEEEDEDDDENEDDTG